MRNLSGFNYQQFIASDRAQTIEKLEAEEAFVTISGGDIRWRYDGKEPTKSMGHILRDGMNLRLRGNGQIEKFKFVRGGELFSEVCVTLEKI